jgi:hypothetical protein
MKKILTLGAVLVLVLAIGAWGMELGNGITYTDDSPILTQAKDQDRSVEGMSAGGLREEKLVDNGITYFEQVAPVVHEAAPARTIENGVTVFE